MTDDHRLFIKRLCNGADVGDVVADARASKGSGRSAVSAKVDGVGRVSAFREIVRPMFRPTP
jgi:hypothetical protein